MTTLTRLIFSVRERVAERLWQRLSAVVTPEQRTDLEGLLARAGASRITHLERLRRAPSRASAPVLVQALSRLTEVRELDVGPLNLGNVPASRIKALAQYAVTTKAQKEGKKFELLPGFVSAALHRSTDGTRVINYAQFQKAEDWLDISRRADQLFCHFREISKSDPHLYEVVYLSQQS